MTEGSKRTRRIERIERIEPYRRKARARSRAFFFLFFNNKERRWVVVRLS